MSTRTALTAEPVLRPYSFLGKAVVGGLTGGLLFGLLLQFVLGRMPAIGALYTLGEPSLTVGWVAHVAHSALFGLLYGVLSFHGRVRVYTADLRRGLVAGAGFGAALWLVDVIVLWPLWLNAVQFVTTVPLPNLALLPLVGHLTYGTILGGVFALATGD